MIRIYTIFLLFFCIALSAQKSDFKHINFDKADNIAKSCSKMSLKNMPLLVHELTNDLNTQVEQFRAIHTWVCLNIESDHYFSETTLKKRKQLHHNSIAFSEWNTRAQSKVFKRLVRDKKTICSGYAYIVKALTNIADIECEIVDGYARTVRTNVNTVDFPNHSWNVVKLNGKWYFADATQASGFYNLDDHEFIKDYNDGYFLAEPDLFAKNHYPIDTSWLLLDDKSLTLKDFVRAPIIYGSTYKYGIIPKAPETLETTIHAGDTVVFQFDVLDETYLKDITLVMSSGFKFKSIKAKAVNLKKGVLELRHRFTKTGQYDIHAKVGKDIVVSYTIKVEKPKTVNLQHS
ncbi:hypothetical protein EYD45_00265 [Hyunsoonleella flava]|uniref:Transglutaminase-like domain-containing protein n=1 Tax=Hyunsoonleella flava TaxID=2527939 RepID=A0A4Q9FIL6_9FLAO|nr:transglutaminase domain-containing protein [Hyunsoonleella flava]TBN06355.1 hypothetical protein EYD45_00265 [Hyunsoonleella flava]